MLKEKMLFLASAEGEYTGFLDSLNKYFSPISLLNNCKSLSEALVNKPLIGSETGDSLYILIVEDTFINNTSEYLSSNLNTDHYILITFGTRKMPSLTNINNVFESINIGSADFDFHFFINKLQTEINNKKNISMLQFELKEFYEIGKSLSSEKDTLKLFEMIINSSMNLTSSDAGTIYLVVDSDTYKWSTIKNNCYDDKILKFIISKNNSMDVHLEASISPITMKSIFGYTVITGKSIRIEDAYNISSNVDYHHNHYYDTNTGYKTKSMLTIPMKDHENNVMGIIQLINKKKSKFEKLDYNDKSVLNEIIPYDYSDELIMNSLAGQAAVVLENNLLYRDMQDLLQSYKEQNEQLLFLSKNVLKAHEAERKRIARDIHDGPAQSTVNLSLKLEICKKYINNNDTKKLTDELNVISGCIRETVKEIRTIIYDLKPSYLEDGIITALKNRIEIFIENTGIKVEFNHSGNDSVIEYYMASTIYRIVQEALSNILKYAGAKIVKINLDISNKGILLIISDNGKGFDTSELKKKNNRHLEGGFGLEGMRERIELVMGQISIKSAPGKGTSISISIPVQ